MWCCDRAFDSTQYIPGTLLCKLVSHFKPLSNWFWWLKLFSSLHSGTDITCLLVEYSPDWTLLENATVTLECLNHNQFVSSKVMLWQPFPLLTIHNGDVCRCSYGSTTGVMWKEMQLTCCTHCQIWVWLRCGSLPTGMWPRFTLGCFGCILVTLVNTQQLMRRVKFLRGCRGFVYRGMQQYCFSTNVLFIFIFVSNKGL